MDGTEKEVENSRGSDFIFTPQIIFNVYEYQKLMITFVYFEQILSNLGFIKNQLRLGQYCE